MVRQPLTSAAFLAVLLAATLVSGCASTYGPPARPSGAPPGAPGEGEARPGELPAPDVSQDEPAAAGDARTPTLALLRQSERSANDGDLDGAIAYVERAIRLDSRDAALWLRLARLQLAANHPGTAEQIAHRAIALAGDQTQQQREGWLLVADALEAQGKDDDAADIRARWRTYRG